MEEFLLTREPLDIVRISTSLFVRVEEGEWIGVLKKEVKNFENVLKRVLEQVPSEDYGIITSEEADVHCNIITSYTA
ncbi:13387_t:CDS:2, partial [Funneliformis geosporum]